MKIRTIKLGLSRNYNLGNYNNVRPSFEMEIEVEESDDLDRIISKTWELVQHEVHNEIDNALEEDGKPARFSEAERCDSYICNHRKMIVVVPQGGTAPKSMDTLFASGYRISTVRQYHVEQRADCTIHKLIPERVDPNAVIPVLISAICEYWKDPGDTPKFGTTTRHEKHSTLRKEIMDFVDNFESTYSKKEGFCCRIQILANGEPVGLIKDGKYIPVEESSDIPF